MQYRPATRYILFARKHAVDARTTICRRCGVTQAEVDKGIASADCAAGDNVTSLRHRRALSALRALEQAFNDAFDDYW
jgi:hypothetical protein